MTAFQTQTDVIFKRKPPYICWRIIYVHNHFTISLFVISILLLFSLINGFTGNPYQSNNNQYYQ